VSYSLFLSVCTTTNLTLGTTFGGQANTCGICNNYETQPAFPYGTCDCLGTPNGTATTDNCGTCDADASNDCPADCNGDWGGSAYTDECDDCVGGNTGFTACIQDNCGIWGGNNSPNTGSCDCNSAPNGTATLDNCNICSGGTTGLDACVQDCTGVWGGTEPNTDGDGICDNLQGTITDIAGNSYKTIIIGTQTWMAENLKTTHYNNGDEIPTGYTGSEWIVLETGAYAVYDDDPSNADIYGNLYNWAVVGDDRGVCPDGFHVSSYDEYTILSDYLGGESVAGGKMKSTGTIEGGDGLWDSPNEGATNESGFTGLPAGYRGGNNNNGSYGNLGYSTKFWTSTEHSISYVYYMSLYYNSAGLHHIDYRKDFGYSIRCLKD